MNRPFLACAFLALASAALCAQQSNPATQSGPYSGTSSPPPDETIETSEPPQPQPQPLPKPRAGKPMNTPAPSGQPTATGQPSMPGQPADAQAGAPAPAMPPVDVQANRDPNDGTDGGIVQVAPSASAQEPQQPSLSSRSSVVDPDGDIVHPEPLPPGVLG